MKNDRERKELAYAAEGVFHSSEALLGSSSVRAGAAGRGYEVEKWTPSKTDDSNPLSFAILHDALAEGFAVVGICDSNTKLIESATGGTTSLTIAESGAARAPRSPLTNPACANAP